MVLEGTNYPFTMGSVGVFVALAATELGIKKFANMMSESKHYPSPMPAVGVYMALATLVCLVLILCDLFRAYRRAKPWIPVRFFKISSFTIYLLGIAAKFPSDLTTEMLSGLEQLSKLCGIQLLTICLVYMIPSIGSMNDSEFSNNLAAFALMTLTVTVNVGIQIATVVISSFKVELIMTLILLSIILLMLCLRTVSNDDMGKMMIEQRQSLFNSSSTNLVEDLKKLQLFDSISSSELIYYHATHYATMGLLCVINMLILLEASFRALSLHGHSVSDYAWSVGIVVGTQMLTIIVATGAIGFRWFFLTTHTELDALSNLGRDNAKIWKDLGSISTPWRIYSWAPLNYMKRFYVMEIFQLLEDLVQTLKFLMQNVFQWTDLKVVVAVFRVKHRFGKRVNIEPMIFVAENIRLPFRSALMGGCLQNKSKRSMNASIKGELKSRSDHLLRLLANNCPSNQQQPHYSDDEGINNCLLVVLLVRVSAALKPSATFLFQVLEQDFKTILFLEKVNRAKNVKDMHKRDAAETIWMSRKISIHWSQKKLIQPLLEQVQQNKNSWLKLELFCFPGMHIINNEVEYIFKIINDHQNQTNEWMEEVCNKMNQVVIDILRVYVGQIPKAICNYVSESPYHKLEERIRFSLGILCRIGLIDSRISCLQPLDARDYVVAETQVVVDCDSQVAAAGISSSSS